MKKNIFLFVLGLVFTFVFAACEDLNIENTNSPTFDEINDPALAYDKVGELLYWKSWCSYSCQGSEIGFYCSADVGTSSIRNNWDTWVLSSEPRSEYPNENPNFYTYNEGNYELHYMGLAQANNALLSISKDENAQVKDVEMCKAVAYYTQAFFLGKLGLIFDKAFVVTEYTDLTELQNPVSYELMIDSAIVICEKAIAICNTSTFTIPKAWLPANDTYTNVELGRLVNTLAARLLIYKSRNASQNSANDWAKILEYSENGIQMDYAPIMDGGVWCNWYMYYGRWHTGIGIDMRVVNLMDSSMYPWFPASGDINDLPHSGVATSADARLNSDFEFSTLHNGWESRGIYHYSTYRYKRYDYYIDNDFIGELPCILRWENDMIKAEALVRTGKLSEAADILNDPAGPRKVRGGLPDVAVNETDLLSAIYYEKTIECMLTTEMTEFYDMRRRDMLQEGTPLHLPIPVEELEILGIPVYSFGGWDKVSPFYNKSTYGYE